MRSAVTLVKLLLKHRRDLTDSHCREFLGKALWKVTEAETPKYKTRYRSEKSQGATKLRHDHVFQRKKMVDELLAHPENADEILAKAIGCTITEDEHNQLNQFAHLDGLDRYEQARIVVLDMETGKPRATDPLPAVPLR